MRTPNSMEMGKMSPLPTPSAPPYSPPLSPLPPSSPLAFPPHEDHSTVTANTQPVPWSTGICGCCNDCHSCWLTCWCPCITFGRIAEMVDRGSTSCGVSGALYMLILCATGCCCMYSCFYRSKLRGQYFLKETPCTDCCVHCCCQPCALCQEYRELQHQDLDMSIGWFGNMERKKRVATVPPEVEGGMLGCNK